MCAVGSPAAPVPLSQLLRDTSHLGCLFNPPAKHWARAGCCDTCWGHPALQEPRSLAARPSISLRLHPSRAKVSSPSPVPPPLAPLDPNPKGTTASCLALPGAGHGRPPGPACYCCDSHLTGAGLVRDFCCHSGRRLPPSDPDFHLPEPPLCALQPTPGQAREGAKGVNTGPEAHVQHT